MTLRQLCITSLAAVCLVACGKEPAAPASTTPAANAVESRAMTGSVTLVSDGLRISPAPAVLTFGTPSADVQAALTAALGSPATTGENPDCPTGAVQYLSWGDGLGIVTRGGAFIGWTAGPTGPQTTSGVRAGMTRAEALAKGATEDPDSQFPVTPISIDGVSGFLDEAGATVDELFAGEVCIAS